MAQTGQSRLDRQQKAVGAIARGPDLAIGAMPIERAGLSHPQSDPGYHPAGSPSLPRQQTGRTLLSALVHGTEPAQFENHPPNGSIELQNTRESETGDPPAFPGAQPGAPAHARSGPTPPCPFAAGELCRQPGGRPALRRGVAPSPLSPPASHSAGRTVPSLGARPGPRSSRTP